MFLRPICMNCHKVRTQRSETGTEEIARSTRRSTTILTRAPVRIEGKPLHWVRVHNPRISPISNHAQHVKVGQVACQTCHGPGTGQHDRRFAVLTAHHGLVYRLSPQDAGENGRQRLLCRLIIPSLSTICNTPDSVITVAKIGGLECSRCHY